MLMRTLEIVPVIAQHQRTRRHQSVTQRGTVLKRPCQYDRDHISRVLFFVRPILWPTRAHDVAHSPTGAMREDVSALVLERQDELRAMETHQTELARELAANIEVEQLLRGRA